MSVDTAPIQSHGLPPAAHAAALTARGVTKAFDGRGVLNEIDINIAPGDFISIVGRSGCGKSTLLRLLVGLDTPTSGAIDRSGSAPRLMFQEPRLLPWARVGENVGVGLGREVRSDADRDAIERALQAVGLADRARAWPATL